MLPILDEFDRICVINLPERTDRRMAVQRELERVGTGFSNSKVQLFAATRCSEALGFPSPSVRGCFLSHLSVIRNARADGLRNVLVLEDDVALSPLLTPYSGLLREEVVSQSWGFLYFGHVERLASVETPRVIPFDGPLMTAHCYAISASVLDPLIEYLEAVLQREPGDPRGGPMHYDGALTMFRQANPHILTLIAQPSLASQRSSRSDIHQAWYEKLPGLRFGADMARSLREYYRASRR